LPEPVLDFYAKEYDEIADQLSAEDGPAAVTS
jgi:hypothetical protein